MVDFYDGVKDSIRVYCLVVIEMVIGGGFCMNIKTFCCI
jgi:hypothetical protein